MASSPTEAFPKPDHNHGACRDASLARARKAFEDRGLRLTEQRAAVFAEIAASHHAIGAYDILDRLARLGQRLAPVSIYRAIDALIEAGVIHRLESRNAYFACHAAHGGERQYVVLACATCGTVAEVPAEGVFEGIEAVARQAGFVPNMRLVEVLGLCAHCRQTSSPAGALA